MAKATVDAALHAKRKTDALKLILEERIMRVDASGLMLPSASITC